MIILQHACDFMYMCAGQIIRENHVKIVYLTCDLYNVTCMRRVQINCQAELERPLNPNINTDQ